MNEHVMSTIEWQTHYGNEPPIELFDSQRPWITIRMNLQCDTQIYINDDIFKTMITIDHLQLNEQIQETLFNVVLAPHTIYNVN